MKNYFDTPKLSIRILLVFPLLYFPDILSPGEETAPKPTMNYTYKIIHTYPHDPAAYTQGLIYHNGYLYESTGLRGASSLRKVELETGKIVMQVDLASRYFGEGLALVHDRIIQLTWTSHIAFLYNLHTFDPMGTFSYPGEGWGLTYDGKRLILSDGSTRLRFLHPETYEEIGSLPITDQGQPLSRLNELEWVEEKIYANIWMDDRIAILDPDSGQVSGWIDCTGIISASERGNPFEHVLNGIAYDHETKRLFITGKRWPKLFEIQRIEPSASSKEWTQNP